VEEKDGTTSEAFDETQKSRTFGDEYDGEPPERWLAEYFCYNPNVPHALCAFLLSAPAVNAPKDGVP
jgi:hypothetical protein